MTEFTVAVVGATGAVGQEMLETLRARNFPAKKIVPLASSRSAGGTVRYGDQNLVVENLDTYDFTGTNIGLFSPGAAVSAIYAPRAAAQGCVVIDNTSHFRMDADVPLVVPEVNPHAIADYTKRGIIANPNCSTIQMLVALKPLHDRARIKRIVVSTYQAVSGAGHEAMDELRTQTAEVLAGKAAKPERFVKQIAFNLIPQIDVFLEDGTTKEEWKMVVETHKILDPAIKVTATCVRVPVFSGHSESVNIELDSPLSVREAREILAKAEGVVLADDPSKGVFTTPLEAVGRDGTFVSRVRADTTVPNGLNLWVVSDNLRKGAALNAVQIAEVLARDYLRG